MAVDNQKLAALLLRCKQTVERGRYLVEQARQLVAQSSALSRTTHMTIAVSRETRRTILPACDQTAAAQPAADAVFGPATEDRRFPAVTHLIAAAEHVAACDAETLNDLIAGIKLLLRDDADLNLLVGVLLEGIVQAVSTITPRQLRRETAAATSQLLLERLRSVAGLVV